VSTGALSSVNMTRSISLSSTLDAHFADGSFEQAISLHRGVLQFGEMTNDLGCQTKACVDLGCIFERLGEHMEALSMHTKGLDLATKAGNEELQGIAYNNMGNANFRIGRFAEALELLVKGFEKFKTIGDESKQAIAIGNIGCAQFSLGRLREAFLSFETSLKLSEEVEDLSGHARALGNLGNVLHASGQLEDAIRLYFTQVEFMQKQFTWPTPVTSKQDLPQQYNALIAMQGDAFNNLAKALSDSDRQTEAVLQAVRAVAFHQRIEERQGANDAFRVIIFEQQEISYKILQCALLALDRMGPALAVAGMRKARALAHALGVVEASDCPLIPFLNEDEPAAALKAADAYLEAKWQRVQHMSLAQGKTTSVVEFSFLGETLIIWVVSCGELLCCAKVSSNGLGAEEEELLSRVRKGMKVLGRDAMASSSTETECQDNGSHPVSSTRAKVKELGTDELGREEMAQEEALLQQLYQALIAPVAMHLDNSMELLIVPHQALFEVPWAALIDPDGRYLIEKHVIRVTPSLHVAHQEAEALDEDGGHALIVGNPYPNSIGSLKGAEEEAQSVASIIQNQEIEVRLCMTHEATKARVLQDLQGAAWAHLACHYDKDTNSLVLASAPHDLRDRLAQLREEIRIMGDNVSKAAAHVESMQVAMSEASRQKQFQKALDLQARVSSKISELKELEGRKETADKEVQRLEAARGSSNDDKNGLVAMEEVQGTAAWGLPRHKCTGGKPRAADTFWKSTVGDPEGVRMGIGSTVVLSACNSGRGKINAEGVVGLSRSFLIAGAAAAVVSLWSVEDRSTAALMQQMYKYLVDDPTVRLTVPQALRLAMLRLASRSAPGLRPPEEIDSALIDFHHKWKRPMHWAGFIVVGANTRLPTRLK